MGPNFKIIMKRFFAVLALVAICATAPVQAQDYKDVMKERKAMSKMTENELNSKVSKAVKKEAKALKKEGWKTVPGALPLEKQLERSFKMQYEFDEYGYPLYIYGDAQSVGGNYDAAKMQATNLAKVNLAGNIQTEVVALVENAVANKQLDQGEAVSTTESVMGGTNIIADKIGRVIPVIELYREAPHKSKEVRVILFYNSKMAKQAVKEAIAEDLEKRGHDLVDKVNNMLGL